MLNIGNDNQDVKRDKNLGFRNGDNKRTVAENRVVTYIK